MTFEEWETDLKFLCPNPERVWFGGVSHRGRAAGSFWSLQQAEGYLPDNRIQYVEGQLSRDMAWIVYWPKPVKIKVDHLPPFKASSGRWYGIPRCWSQTARCPVFVDDGMVIWRIDRRWGPEAQEHGFGRAFFVPRMKFYAALSRLLNLESEDIHEMFWDPTWGGELPWV